MPADSTNEGPGESSEGSSSTMMRFDIFGRYHLLVGRRDGRWIVYREGLGTRRIDPTVSVPGDLPEEDVGRFLEDLLHEEARPDTGVTRVDPRS